MAHTRFEGRWLGAYIVSDDIHLSREVVTFAAGAVIEPGTVLDRITASGKILRQNISRDALFRQA